MLSSTYIYPNSIDFKQICCLYRLKHLQKCIQSEKNKTNSNKLTDIDKYKKNIDLNNEVANVSILKSKEACINIMYKYNIGLDDNIDDLIMGDHLKIMLKKERDNHFTTLSSLHQVIHNSPKYNNDYIIELQEQLKLERAENERLQQKLDEYQILAQDTVLISNDNLELERERAEHKKTKQLAQKYKNKILEMFAD
jgi:hypothetical protein